MLRPYNFPYSKIQKVQSFVNHVMLDVVFNAKNIAAANFTSALVLPKYRHLVDDIKQDYILDRLKESFVICKTLTRKQIKLLKTAVHNNNKIRELCDGTIQPVKYYQIETISSDLKKALKLFCDCLYDNCLGLAPFYNTYEDINTYYKSIVLKSKTCRCCGIGPILTKFHTHRGI